MAITGLMTSAIHTETQGTDSCVAAVGGDGTMSGQWTAGCSSEVSDRGYTRYYVLNLSVQKQVIIGLQSSVDTFVYLREGRTTSGTAMYHNDDIDNSNRNSQIVATLRAGTYTIEATTYNIGETGRFTLTVTDMSTDGAAGSDGDSDTQASGGT